MQPAASEQQMWLIIVWPSSSNSSQLQSHSIPSTWIRRENLFWHSASMTEKWVTSAEWHLKSTCRPSATVKSQNGDLMAERQQRLWRHLLLTFCHKNKTNLINTQLAVPSQKLPYDFFEDQIIIIIIKLLFFSQSAIWISLCPSDLSCFCQKLTALLCVIPPLMWSEEIFLIIENQFQAHLTDQEDQVGGCWMICPEKIAAACMTSTQSPEELQASSPKIKTGKFFNSIFWREKNLQKKATAQ